MTSIYDVVGNYGPGWRPGVLIDDLDRAVTFGLKVVNTGTKTWVVGDDPNDFGRAYPVVCGDIIGIVTEDGPTDGRCGVPVDGDRWGCTGHADQRDWWQGLTELEKVQVERMEDEYR